MHGAQARGCSTQSGTEGGPGLSHNILPKAVCYGQALAQTVHLNFLMKKEDKLTHSRTSSEQDFPYLQKKNKVPIFVFKK